VTEFTPVQSLVGGGLIGLAATLLMLGHGKVLGASGILGGVVFPNGRADFAWKAMVVVGLAGSSLIGIFVFDLSPNVVPPVALWMVAVGGLIVGVGVTVGGGCTSGHGICGLARFSPRSLVAVLTFMATAFATVFLIRHVYGG